MSFFPHIIFKKFFWSASSWLQLLLLPQATEMLNNCHRLFLTSDLGIGLFCKVSAESGPNNDNTLGVGLFQGAVRQVI